MRPALTLRTADDEREHRLLAELDGKPWAAQDGELWHAAFAGEVSLDAAVAIELTVAPDIVVTLRGGDGSPPPAPRRSASAAARDLERLKVGLAAVERTLADERERRGAVEHALEQERAETRRLRAQAGELRARLELADAARGEADAAWRELEQARRDLEAAQRRHELLRREHREAVDARTRDRAALDDRTEELTAASEALATMRAQSGQLRAELAGARERQPPPRARDDDPAARSLAAAADQPTRVQPTAAHRHVVDDADWGPATEGRRHRDAPGPPPRPVNPSLRRRTNWFGRLLALLVLAAVIVAIVLVVRSTISP